MPINGHSIAFMLRVSLANTMSPIYYGSSSSMKTFFMTIKVASVLCLSCQCNKAPYTMALDIPNCSLMKKLNVVVKVAAVSLSLSISLKITKFLDLFLCSCHSFVSMLRGERGSPHVGRFCGPCMPPPCRTTPQA